MILLWGHHIKNKSYIKKQLFNLNKCFFLWLISIHKTFLMCNKLTWDSSKKIKKDFLSFSCHWGHVKFCIRKSRKKSRKNWATFWSYAKKIKEKGDGYTDFFLSILGFLNPSWYGCQGRRDSKFRVRVIPSRCVRRMPQSDGILIFRMIHDLTQIFMHEKSAKSTYKYKFCMKAESPWMFQIFENKCSAFRVQSILQKGWISM